MTLRVTWLILVLAGIGAAGCDKQLHRFDVAKIRIGKPIPTLGATDGTFEITDRQPLAAAAGDTVSLIGRGFTPTMILKVDGHTVSPTVTDPSHATFVMPDLDTPRAMSLLASEGTVTKRIDLVFTGNVGDFPVMTLPPEQVCAGQQYYGVDGSLQSGSRTCLDSVAPPCNADGGVSCVASNAFPSVDKATKLVAGNIKMGVTIAGVTGSVVEGSQSACANDGDGNCVVNGTTFKAAKLANFAASVIASGTTIAGVGGTATLESHAVCAASGTQNCVASGTYFAGTTCTVDGSNCYLPSYAIGMQPLKAIDFSTIDASKMLTTLTISGKTGTIAAQTLNLAATFPGAGYYASAINTPVATNIKSGATIAGVTGSAIQESHADCTAENQSGCVSTTNFKTADTATLADKVVLGQTVAGVSGNVTLPAVGVVLASNHFGVNGTTLSGTLTLPTAANVRASNGAFGTSGNSVTPTLGDCSVNGSACYLPTYAAGTQNLKAVDYSTINSTKMLDTLTLAGVSGTVTLPGIGDVRQTITYGPANSLTGTLDPGAGVPANCSSDAQTNCVAVTNFPALDRVTALTKTAKIHSSVTVGGVVGALSDCAVNGSACYLPTYASGTQNLKAIDFSTIDASKMHTSMTVAGVTGTLTLPIAAHVRTAAGAFGFGGAGTTPTLADCSTDGGMGCVAVGPTYAAALMTGLAPKVLTGQTVAGVGGSATAESHINCTADNQTGCLATPTYKSADTSSFVASDVKSGKTIAGVAGSVANCAANGSDCFLPTYVNGSQNLKAIDYSTIDSSKMLTSLTVSGVAGTIVPKAPWDLTLAFPGAGYYTSVINTPLGSAIATGSTIIGVPGSSIIEGHINCTADNQTGCVSTTTYRSADTIGLNNKVLSGQTVAGVSGNVVLPAVGKVLTGTNYGVAGTGLAGTLTLPTATNVLSGSGTYGDPGAFVTPSLASHRSWNLTTTFPGAGYYPGVSSVPGAASIASGNTIVGVAGSATLEAHSPCASNGSQGCIANSTYYAATACTADGSNCFLPTYSSGSQNLKAIDYSTIVAADMLSTRTISGVAGTIATKGVWNLTASYPGDGYYTGVSNNPIATTIASGTTITGVSGSGVIESHVNCTSDSQTGCLSSSPYVAAYTTGLASKVISGQTVAGFAGNVTLPLANTVHTGSPSYGISGTQFAPSYSPDFPDVANVTTTDTVNGSAGTLDLTNLTAANVKKNVLVGGVLGDYPSATHPLFGDTVTADLPAFSSTSGGGSYEWFKSDGTLVSGVIEANVSSTPGIATQTYSAGLYRQVSVGGDANLVSTNILTTKSIFGVNGSVIAEAHSDCTGNAQTGCVTTSTWKSADLINLTAANIKKSVTVAGVAGDYPSATNKLVGDTATPDLPDFSSVTGGTMYEWFKADGTVVSGTVQTNPVVTPTSGGQVLNAGIYRQVTISAEPNLVAGNIKSGVSIFSVAGSVTMESHSDCAINGSQGCVANGSYRAALVCAADTSNCYVPAYVTTTQPLKAISYDSITAAASKVRTSTSLSGVPGTLADCASDGDQGCVVMGPNMAAAGKNTTNADKILSGQSVGGNAGTLTLPAVANVLFGTGNYGVLTNLQVPALPNRGVLTTTASFPGAGYFTGVAGLGVADVCSTTSVNGSTGTAMCTTSCTTDGQTNCKVSALFVAANTSGRSALDIRAAVTFAGFTGTLDFPDLFGSGIHHTKGATAFTLQDELNSADDVSVLSTGSFLRRQIPKISIDDEGGPTSTAVTKVVRTSDGVWGDTSIRKACGKDFATIADRITDCEAKNPNVTPWVGAQNGNSAEGSWTLVTIHSASANGTTCGADCREVWRDDRTQLLWSDPLTQSGTDEGYNWCIAVGSGNAGPFPESDATCGNANTTPYSTCTEYAGLSTNVGFDNDKGGMKLAATGSSPSVRWRVPTKADYTLADLNGLRQVLRPSGASAGYWAATVSSNNRTMAWQYNFNSGNFAEVVRTTAYLIRCVGRAGP